MKITFTIFKWYGNRHFLNLPKIYRPRSSWIRTTCALAKSFWLKLMHNEAKSFWMSHLKICILYSIKFFVQALRKLLPKGQTNQWPTQKTELFKTVLGLLQSPEYTYELKDLNFTTCLKVLRGYVYSFLSNFPEATFIQGTKSIPDSRVVGFIDAKGTDVVQPIWLRDCPTLAQKKFLGCF